VVRIGDAVRPSASYASARLSRSGVQKVPRGLPMRRVQSELQCSVNHGRSGRCACAAPTPVYVLRCGMDRATIEEHLEQARRHVAEGEEHVARQQQIVDELERDGHDTTQAREVLKVFEETLATHVADQERLEQELASAGGLG
jgi:hypothetical protein